MGYGVWGVSPFLLHTIAGIPKSYGFSGVMGLEVYGLRGVQPYTVSLTTIKAFRNEGTLCNYLISYLK